MVVDANADTARTVAAEVGAEATADWRHAIDRADVGAVVVATPNGLLADIAIAALDRGKHVLVEKPMGRNLEEAARMRAAALASGTVFKVGFNHRYHPAIAEAHRRFSRGDIGSLINIRCRYGHGGRPGYEREWRGNRELAGGGELTDQGVHVVDLINWFAGPPATAYAMLQTAVWPLGDLEDNAFGMFRWPGGAVALLHTSWTQWKNLFSLEVFGDRGALIIEGLGRSYGTETLIAHTRQAAGGAPETETVQYPGDDPSWTAEWEDFMDGVAGVRQPMGGPDDGLTAMSMLDALYRSAAAAAPVDLHAPAAA